jgi:hypothetical protein
MSSKLIILSAILLCGPVTGLVTPMPSAALPAIDGTCLKALPPAEGLSVHQDVQKAANELTVGDDRILKS